MRASLKTVSMDNQSVYTHSPSSNSNIARESKVEIEDVEAVSVEEELVDSDDDILEVV